MKIEDIGRYGLNSVNCYDISTTVMEPDPEGDFVWYSDVVKFIEELKKEYEEKIEQLNKKICGLEIRLLTDKGVHPWRK